MIYELPLFTFFNNLRKHPDFELGLNEYFELIQILQQDISYLESKQKIYNLCELLWFKPQHSYMFFKRLFNESFKIQESIFDNQENTIKPIDNQQKENTPPIQQQHEHIDTQKKTNYDDIQSKTEDYTSEQSSINNEKLNKILYLHFASDSQANRSNQDENTETSKLSHNFRLDNNFVPFSGRQYEQQWSIFPRKKQLNKFENQIDIAKTIHQMSSKGILNQFLFYPKTYNPQKIFILIDAGESMLAFHKWAEFIAESLQKATNAPIQKYYCEFPPESYTENQHIDYLLYTHPSMLKSIKMQEQISFHKQNLCLIISDAGAAIDIFNNEQINQIITFINTIKQKYTSKVVWLNPMPQVRWAGTNASPLAKNINMFHTDLAGIKNAAQILTGKRKN